MRRRDRRTGGQVSFVGISPLSLPLSVCACACACVFVCGCVSVGVCVSRPSQHLSTPSPSESDVANRESVCQIDRHPERERQ